MLIEAFASVAKTDSLLHLVIAGPDQVGWQSSLKQLSEKLGIAARITWPGMLSGDLKWGAFRCAELFCLPSHQENFGIVVTKPWLVGLPVAIAKPVNIAVDVAQAGAGIVHDDITSSAEKALRQWLAMPPTAKAEMVSAAGSFLLSGLIMHLWRKTSSLFWRELFTLVHFDDRYQGQSIRRGQLQPPQPSGKNNLADRVVSSLSPDAASSSCLAMLVVAAFWSSNRFSLLRLQLCRDLGAVAFAHGGLFHLGSPGDLLFHGTCVSGRAGRGFSGPVHLCTGSHDYESEQFRLFARPIAIGADAWVCAEAFVGPFAVSRSLLVP